MDSKENGYQAVPKEIVEKAIEKAKNIESIDEVQQDAFKKNTNENGENDPSVAKDWENKIEAINNYQIDKITDVKVKLIYYILKKEEEMYDPRQKMRRNIQIFLVCQLVFLAILISLTFISKGWFGSFNDKMFLEILNFLKFYITVIIAEFIAMIFFIVKYLFNTKLIDIVKSWVDKL